MVLDRGMSTGLDHVRLEDAIREADVSRTATYRCWPHRDDFVVDLLAALATHALPIASTRGDRATSVLRDVIEQDPASLRTVDGRRATLRRAVSATARDDLLADRDEGRRWRVYLGLALAIPALSDGESRARVSAAVAQAEAQVLDRLERNYRHLLGLFGFTATVDMRELAGIGLAVMRGLVVGSYAGSATDAGAAYALLVDGTAVAVDSSNWGDERIRQLLDEVSGEDTFDLRENSAPHGP